MNSSETLAMLIKFFNMQAGTACRSNNEWNQKKVNEALEAGNNDIFLLKAHIRVWVQENETSEGCLNRCMDAFIEAQHTTKAQEQPAPAPTETVAPPTEQAVGSAMGILEQAVVSLIAKTQTEKIENEIMGQVEATIRNFIKEEYGTIERKITTVVDGKKVPMQGIQHEKFETVLKFVSNNEPVFLTGPAGSGKNELCKQVAKALGLNFYFTNAVTQEYKLTGFTDANGKYQETQFYKAFTEGGLFMLDEMDASIPEVLIILNAAIANGYFDFPAPIGYKEAHPDFRVIAAGNTTGHGASFEYVGRTQLDGASLDRFAVVQIDYSKAIENGVACGNTEIADFCREFRQSAQKAGLQVIVSYRAIKRLAKMVQLLSLEEAIDTCLIKGLEPDDVKIIANNLHESKYKRAMLAIANKEVA